MDVVIGIDLGTTFSCVAYINEEGLPVVIPNADNAEITPSVVHFDGQVAYVGKKANDRKIMPTSPVFEYIKRDIGKANVGSRYLKNGFDYRAIGLSSIILRKLKKDAFVYLKRQKLIPPDAEEKSYLIPAIITVPAYFGDLQRNETRNAGIAAGLNVISIINEPTAAALAFGRSLSDNKKIMVFDLGGGTFDVTILRIVDGEGVVVASDGADQLGGKDWDELIMDYLYGKYKDLTGHDIPQDLGWDIQQKALQAKHDLSEYDSTTITISSGGTDYDITLFRKNENTIEDDFDMETGVTDTFFFDERSENLLALCRAICSSVLSKSGYTWGDIDEIVMAGGSCRMPMIAELLEKLSGKPVPRSYPNFSYDTSIAIGAAIAGSNKFTFTDVASKTIGIEVRYESKPYIEHLILKNTPLPCQFEQSFMAEKNAILKVYEGDSNRPDESVLRGRLELGNPEGDVNVKMILSADGVLSSKAIFHPNIAKELTIKTDDADHDVAELKNKIAAIDIRL